MRTEHSRFDLSQNISLSQNWLRAYPDPVGIYVTHQSGKRGKITGFLEVTPTFVVYYVRLGGRTVPCLYGELARW